MSDTTSKKNQDSTKGRTEHKTSEKKQDTQQEKTQSTQSEQKEHGFLVDAAENIEEGAKVVGEKASEFAGEVIDKFKRGATDVYAAGTKLVDELTSSAQHYVERYQQESEVRKLAGERDKLLTQLGMNCFTEYKSAGEFKAEWFKEQKVQELVKEIEKLDKEIVKIGKKLDKSKGGSTK